jgi:uncharacterized transporter YbjL
MIPDADFVLLADDVIHLVGKPTAVAEAKDFLKNGTIG